MKSFLTILSECLKAILPIVCIGLFLAPGTSFAALRNSFAQEATDVLGDSVIVWETKDLVTSEHSVRASVFWVLAGTWSAPTTLSSPGQHAVKPLVAMNASGNAVAVWKENEGLYASTLPANGTWSTPPDLISNLSDLIRDDYTISINTAGLMVATYSSYTTDHVYVVEANFGGAWGAPTQVSN